VLVVDDDPDTRTSFRDVLHATMKDVHVETAASGEEALSKLDSEPTDLILADYRMPRMDGVRFLTYARERAPGVPRVLITAFPDLRVAMKAINEGHVSGFFLKPVEPETLLEVVQDSIQDHADVAKRARRIAHEMDAFRRSRTRGRHPSGSTAAQSSA
jgi:DNA-binding NtrC family response regulator